MTSVLEVTMLFVIVILLSVLIVETLRIRKALESIARGETAGAAGVSRETGSPGSQMSSS